MGVAYKWVSVRKSPKGCLRMGVTYIQGLLIGEGGGHVPEAIACFVTPRESCPPLALAGLRYDHHFALPASWPQILYSSSRPPLLFLPSWPQPTARRVDQRPMKSRKILPPLGSCTQLYFLCPDPSTPFPSDPSGRIFLLARGGPLVLLKQTGTESSQL